MNPLQAKEGNDERMLPKGMPLPSSLPPGFKLTEEGVYKLWVSQKEGEKQKEWRLICSKLEVIAFTRDREGLNHGRLLKVTTPEGQIHEWAMPMRMLAGDGACYREELLKLGLVIEPDRHARYGLHEYISKARPDAKVLCVEKVGWHEGAFVLPQQTFEGQDKGEQVRLQTSHSIPHAFHVSGTLEEWQEKIAKPCSGNSRLVFALSLAFAAPLLEVLGEESGGFHLRGASSIGKTTALYVAASVWGGGRPPYIRQWRATSNGLEGIALNHCDTLLCLDELGQMDGREAGEVAYMLANGMGKNRARRSGAIRPAAQWRVLFLSSGEGSLKGKIHDAGKKAFAGQDVRFIDLAADAGKGHGVFETLPPGLSAEAFARLLKEASTQLYGTAIHAYLNRLAKERESIPFYIKQVKAAFEDDYCPSDADGQVKRVASRFGLMAAAGELAIQWGLLPWPQEEARKAAASCFQGWLEVRGGLESAEIMQAIDHIKAFFAEYGHSRFESLEEGEIKPRIPNRAGGERKMLTAIGNTM
jgi:uncharacterized protein (DUF927 family)